MTSLKQESSFEILLQEGMSLSSLPPLSPLEVSLLAKFHFFLQKWNKTINLTGHRDLKSSVELNFIDSLQLAYRLPSVGNVLDLGSGAGFPALVIKILHQNLSMTLAEADQRKTSFLFHAAKELSLENIYFMNEFLTVKKMESLIQSENFSHIVSRATFSPKELVTLLHPLLIKEIPLFLMLSIQQLINFKKNVKDFDFFLEREYFLPFSRQKRIILGLKIKN